MVKIIN